MYHSRIQKTTYKGIGCVFFSRTFIRTGWCDAGQTAKRQKMPSAAPAAAFDIYSGKDHWHCQHWAAIRARIIRYQPSMAFSPMTILSEKPCRAPPVLTTSSVLRGLFLYRSALL